MEEFSTADRAQIFIQIVLGSVVSLLNLISLVAILRSRSLLPKLKVLYTSLVVSDTLLGFLLLIERVIPYVYKVDHIICNIRMYCGHMVHMVTIYTHLLLALERFLCINMVMNFYQVVTWKKLLSCVIIIWLFSVVSTIAAFSGGFGSQDKCLHIVSGNAFGYIYSSFTACFTFIIIMGIYIYIGKVIKIHTRRIGEVIVDESQDGRRRRNLAKTERRTHVTVAIIATFFGISYVPMSIFILSARLFVPDATVFMKQTWATTTYYVLATIYIMNSLINPFVYFWQHENYRKEIIDRMLCRKVSSESIRHSCRAVQEHTNRTNDTGIQHTLQQMSR